MAFLILAAFSAGICLSRTRRVKLPSPLPLRMNSQSEISSFGVVAMLPQIYCCFFAFFFPGIQKLSSRP